MKGMIKLALTLAAFAAVACAGLAVVYTQTKDSIEANKGAKTQAALKEVFPAAERFVEVDVAGLESLAAEDARYKGMAVLAAYRAELQGGRLGYAVRVGGNGYASGMELLAGYANDQKVARVSILRNNDTPGLGKEAGSAKPVDKERGLSFLGQFEGRSASEAFEAKKDVIAISASTITSKAVASMVKLAGKAAQALAARDGGAK
jgi:electron transport complex protein RnfG